MQSGEAAEQIVRIAFDGVEHALRIAGGGAQQIIAMLMAAAQRPDKLPKQPGAKLNGKERLKKMLRSGAELKFFEIQGKDLKAFTAAAKQYGITYCALRQKGRENGMVEIVAKAEDAPRLSRIMERLEARDLGRSTHEVAEQVRQRRRIPVISAIGALLAGLRPKAAEPAAPEQSTPDLVNDLLKPAREGRAQPQAPAVVQPEVHAARPSTRTEPSAPSANSSPMKLNDGGTISRPRKPSVKTALEESAARIAAATKPRQQSRAQSPKSKTKKKARTK